MNEELNELLQLLGWTKTETEMSITLKDQLSREISPDHPLYPEMDSFTVVAKATKNDDILLSDGVQRLVIVHLAWQSTPSSNPNFPETVHFADIDQLKIWLEANH